jgi:hypothetical protein
MSYDAPDLSYRATGAAGMLAGTSISDANDMGKLWLPIWSGEVLHAYDEYRMFEPMVTSKTISSGRTIEFPMTGTVDLLPAWGAGEYLLGGDNSKTDTFVITLDKRPMAAHFELDNVDLMITQWEYRQELARQAGQTLANARDRQIAAFIAQAAVVGALDGADVRGIASADLPKPVALGATQDDSTEALAVLEAIEDFCVELQELDVPVQGCYCAVTPKLFQQIRRLGVAESQGDAVNMQPMFGGVAAAGGLGASFTQGMNSLSDSLVYMGVTILKSNHLPNVDVMKAGETVTPPAVDPIGEDRYSVKGATAGVRGLIWMPECVASLRKTGLVVDTEDDIRRNTTFTVASMMSGTGILKPELAKAIVGKATVNRAAFRSDLGGGDFGYATA